VRAVASVLVGRQQWIAVDQQDTELVELGVSRRRQCHRIGLAGFDRVGPGDHVK
jgi:hypothetical protein